MASQYIRLDQLQGVHKVRWRIDVRDGGSDVEPAGVSNDRLRSARQQGQAATDRQPLPQGLGGWC